MQLRKLNGTNETFKHTHTLHEESTDLVSRTEFGYLFCLSSSVVFKGGETGSGDQIQKGMGLMKQAEDWKKQAEGDHWYVEGELD